MKKSNKAILTLACAGCLVIASVFGTLAYLTDDDAVTNTFTVGNVGIELDEADVDDSDEAADRDKANAYHLLPGHTYVKDPTVTVDAESEDAYVRMLVSVEHIDQLKKAFPKYDKEGKEIEANKKYYNEALFLIQMLCNDWSNEIWKYAGYTQEEGSTTGVYEFRYVGNKTDENGNVLNNGIVVKSETETELPALFESITVPGEIDNEHLAHLGDVVIDIEAHAIQVAGFDSAELAWEAFK